MAKTPGRTYRFFTGSPLWSFGSGLSLTDFAVSCVSANTHSATQINCTVHNTGAMSGDEVVLLMHRFGSTAPSSWRSPIPLKALVDFDRVTVPVGVSVPVGFRVTQDALALTSADGDRVVLAGTHYLEVFTGGATPVASVQVEVTKTTILEVVPRPQH
jgi:beta-glucosidase